MLRHFSILVTWCTGFQSELTDCEVLLQYTDVCMAACVVVTLMVLHGDSPSVASPWRFVLSTTDCHHYQLRTYLIYLYY